MHRVSAGYSNMRWSIDITVTILMNCARCRISSSSTNCKACLALRKLPARSEEHTSELQSLMRISYAVFCLKKKTLSDITLTYNTNRVRHLHRHQLQLIT